MNYKCISFFLFLTLPALAGKYTAVDSLDKNLRHVQIANQVLGMSVVVVIGDSVVFNKGYGTADLGRNIAVTESTIYRIASISKSVTATALMQLYEQGRFALDDDISTAMGYQVRNPRFPNDKVTFKQLLTHTSSIIDGSTYNSFLSASYSGSIPKISEILLAGGRYYGSGACWGNYKPGTQFEYANLGFGIIGTLVEKLSGQRFDEFCWQHILQPLGMTASFNVLDLPNFDNIAVLYRRQGSQWIAQTDDYKGVRPAPRDLSIYQMGDNGIIFGPQGGLRTSAADLSKFMRAHMSGGSFAGACILQDTTVARMHQQHWSGYAMGGFYKKKGLGLHITDDLIPGQTLIGHAGEAYGLLSDMYFDQAKRYGMIFIMNGGDQTFTSGVFYAVEEAVFRAAHTILVQDFLLTVDEREIAWPGNGRLDQNYPNPFNASTHLNYSILHPAHVRLIIVNTLGQIIFTLDDGMKNAGFYQASWHGLDEWGRPASSGVYFYQLVIGDQVSAMKKMILIR